MAEDACVKVRAISTVVPEPSLELQHRVIYPSAFDQILRKLTVMQRVLFYEAPSRGLSSAASFAMLVKGLKSSLAKTLALFYPLAGRLEVEANRLPRILCNGAGVEFVEASIEATLADLGDLQPQSIPLQKLFYPYSHAADATDTPFFSVQVTEFQCGGMAIAFSYNHYIADGASIWHFMQSWSEAARGDRNTLTPSHDRVPLCLPSRSPVEGDRSYGTVYRTSSINSGPGFKPEELPKTVQKVFHFSRETLHKLKTLANAGKVPGASPCTTYEVLCGHIWRSVTIARQLEAQAVTKFNIVVDCRRRVVPRPPPALFGNMLCNVIPTAAAGELETQDLTFAASLVQATIKEKASSTEIRHILDWVGRQGNCYIMPNVGLTNDLGVASSPRFPCFAVDFGWGPPVAVRAGLSLWSGTVILFPSPEQPGSIDVSLTLPPYAMHRLSKDIAFC